MIEGGYGTSSPLHNKVNIMEMVRQGRRTLFVDEPRGIERADSKKNPDGIEEFFLRQAEALFATLDTKGIPKTDVVGHSEGCMVAVVAASLYPERFRSLVLFNPGGMIGDDSFVKLCYRFIVKENWAEFKRKREKSPAAQQQVTDGMRGFQKYLFDEKAASVSELRAMAKTQIRALLKKAHENGVLISIIHGADDEVYPMERIVGQTSRAAPDEDLIVDGFYSVKGGHGEFVMDPERWTQIADAALTALEAKSAKVEHSGV